MFWLNVILPRFNFFIFQSHYLILWKAKPKKQWTLQNLHTCAHVSSHLRQKAWLFHIFFKATQVVHLVARITFTFIKEYIFMAKKDLGNPQIIKMAHVSCSGSKWKKQDFWDVKKWLHLDTDLTVSWDCTFETIEIGILLELMIILLPLLV